MKAIIQTYNNRRVYDNVKTKSAKKFAYEYGRAEGGEKVYITTNDGFIRSQAEWDNEASEYKNTYFIPGDRLDV